MVVELVDVFLSPHPTNANKRATAQIAASKRFILSPFCRLCGPFISFFIDYNTFLSTIQYSLQTEIPLLEKTEQGDSLFCQVNLLPYLGHLIAACAAARRAIGTLKGEQET